jgi:hypothetical protein
MRLLRYTVQSEYGKIYEHNLRFIESFGQEELFAQLADYLSTSTAIERRIIVADLKRHILVNNELYFRSFSAQPPYLLLVIFYYVLKCLVTVLYCKPPSKVTIIVDQWAPGVVKRFYGEEFVKAMQSSGTTAFMPFSKSGSINFLSFLRTLKSFFGSLAIAWRIYFKYRINLASYLQSFFHYYLQGETLARLAEPKLIISGNDNGFPVIKAKAAKAKIMLIQNALRPIISDSCFKYADYYVSLEDTEMSAVRREKTGCVFDTVLPFGSLYMYNAIDKQMHYDIRYDIVYASTADITSDEYEKQYGHWYSLSSERQVLKLLNAFAQQSELKIAFKCRYAGETDDLRRCGLISEKITYIAHDQESVYKTIVQSKLLLSSMSTTVWEAILLGRKSACINLSGNDYLNYFYKRFHNEFTPQLGIPFNEFIAQILAHDIDYAHDAVQNPHFIKDIGTIVAQVITHAHEK